MFGAFAGFPGTPPITPFIEEIQKYEFGLTSEDAEKKYKNIRTSYVRYLKGLKNVPSGSGRDAVPKAEEFANLEWLDQHIRHRKSTTNLPNHESDDEEAIDN